MWCGTGSTLRTRGWKSGRPKVSSSLDPPPPVGQVSRHPEMPGEIEAAAISEAAPRRIDFTKGSSLEPCRDGRGLVTGSRYSLLTALAWS